MTLNRTLLATLPALALLALPAAAMDTNTQSRQTPTTEKAGAVTTLDQADSDMDLVITKLQQLGAKPLGTQTVEETRKGPTPADAVKAVLRDQGKDPQQVLTALGVTKQDLSYPTAGGEQPIRIYTPQGQAPQGGWPVVVYYHGGGWVIADIGTYEASAMALASKAQAIVASAEYRHAPEHKFPAAHQDAVAAYDWVAKNAARFGGNPQKLAVAGESAGGNLALNVAIAARDQKLPTPRHMLLVYPLAGISTKTGSYVENANAVPLSRAAMEWFFKNATSGPKDLQDPRLDLVGKADLRGLPSATVVTAHIDPLRSEGEDLAEKLEEAGSDVEHEDYKGVTHEFFGMAPMVADAEEAQSFAAERLKAALQGDAAAANR